MIWQIQMCCRKREELRPERTVSLLLRDDHLRESIHTKLNGMCVGGNILAKRGLRKDTRSSCGLTGESQVGGWWFRSNKHAQGEVTAVGQSKGFRTGEPGLVSREMLELSRNVLYQKNRTQFHQPCPSDKSWSLSDTEGQKHLNQRSVRTTGQHKDAHTQ